METTPTSPAICTRHASQLVGLLLPLLLLAAIAGAQSTELLPGVRVRLSAPGHVAAGFVATVIASSSDTLLLANRHGVQYRIPTRAVTRLEVSRGESRALGAGRGALWGAGIGAGLGMVVALTAESSTSMPDRPTTYEPLDGEERLAVVTVTAVSGAVWGTVIGAIVGSERWERFDVASRVAIVPEARGVSLRLAWRR
ncbi:MAG TPA: hypothetical protein VEA99_05730 [Gemmatimonadaceae bacterium]|nr:hypothetical protein [Gemmatimonadaceae bacterium]